MGSLFRLSTGSVSLEYPRVTIPIGLTCCGSLSISDTLSSSNAPTNPAPIHSLTAVRRINIDAKAPSIIL